MLSVPKNAQVLQPVPVTDPGADQLVAIDLQGHMLVIPTSEVPRLNRGKGIKIQGVNAKKLAAGEERMVAVVSVPQSGALVLHAGKRHLKLKASELALYRSDRGRKGKKLPRGLQRVDKAFAE